MKLKISRKSESDLFKLGIYQLTGGVIGLLILVWAALHTPFLTSLMVLVLFIVAVIFSYSIVCGILCFRLHEQALRYSLINQILQLVSIAAAGFSFHYCAGIYLNFGINLTHTIRLDAGLGISGFIFNFNKEPDEMNLYINIVALLLIIWIERIKKRTNREQMLQGLL